MPPNKRLCGAEASNTNTGERRPRSDIYETTGAILNIAAIAIPHSQPCQIPFYNTVRQATELDDWLSFRDSIPSSTLNQLPARESYKIIASRIQSGLRKSISTGTPGIGKSLSLIYLWLTMESGFFSIIILIQSTTMAKVLCFIALKTL